MLQSSSGYVACRFVQPTWIAAHGGWAATALGGHINFHTVSDTAEEAAHTSQGGLYAIHQGSATSDRAQAGTSPLIPPNTAAAMKQTSVEQSGSRRGLEEGEEGKASVGGSPTSKFANMWRGLALSSSLKQAISDQPASTLAQPVDLEDSDPAQQNPFKAAHQQATMLVTSTNPAHPNTPALPATAHRKLRAQAGTSCVELDSNTTVAVGANKRKPQVTKQPGGYNSGAVATQSIATRTGAGSGAVPAQGTATRAAADSGAVAAQVEAETTADRGSGGVSTAGKVQCSSGHSQQRGNSTRHLEIRMVPASPELVDVEYPLYHKYQVSNHHDKPSKVSGMSYVANLSVFDDVK